MYNFEYRANVFRNWLEAQADALAIKPDFITPSGKKIFRYVPARSIVRLAVFHMQKTKKMKRIIEWAYTHGKAQYIPYSEKNGILPFFKNKEILKEYNELYNAFEDWWVMWNNIKNEEVLHTRLKYLEKLLRQLAPKMPDVDYR